MLFVYSLPNNYSPLGAYKLSPSFFRLITSINKLKKIQKIKKGS